MPTAVRLIGAGLLTAALTTALVTRPSISASTPTGWPSVDLPPQAEAFSISDHMSSNGVPMRVSGFVAKQNMSDTVAWFKAKLGEPLMEDRVGDKTVLGRPDGDYYLTVQIEPSDTGVRGLIATSDMRQALTQREQTRKNQDAWARDLPADTRIVNLMSSQDDGKTSTYLVASNQQSDALNAERATRALQQRGFVVERSVTLEKGALVDGIRIEMSGKGVLFKSADREATVLAFHEPSGKAAIVINTVILTGRAP